MDDHSDAASAAQPPPHSTHQAHAAASAQPVAPAPAPAHTDAAADPSQSSNRHARSISSVQPRAVLVSPDRLAEFAVQRDDQGTREDDPADDDAASRRSTTRQTPTPSAAVAAATNDEQPRPWSSGSATPASASLPAVPNQRTTAAHNDEAPAPPLVSSSSARRPAPLPSRSSVPRTQLIVPQLHASPAPLGTMHAMRASPMVHTMVTGPASIASAMRAQRFYGGARGIRKGAASTSAAAAASHRAEHEVKEQLPSTDAQQEAKAKSKSGVTVLSLPHTDGSTESALPSVEEHESQQSLSGRKRGGGKAHASKPSLDSNVAPIVLLSPSAAFARASAPLPASLLPPAPTPLPVAARFVKSFSRAPPYEYGDAGLVADADFQSVGAKHAQAAREAAENAALTFNALHVTEHSFAPSAAPSRSLKAAPTAAAAIAAKAAQLRKMQLDASRAATRAGWSQGDLAEAAQGVRPLSRENGQAAAQAVQQFLQAPSAPPVVVKIAGHSSVSAAASSARIAATSQPLPPSTTRSAQDADTAMRAALGPSPVAQSLVAAVAPVSAALSSMPATLSGGSSLRYSLEGPAAAPVAASPSSTDILADVLQQSRPGSSPSAMTPEPPVGHLSGSEAAHLNAHWHSRSGMLRAEDGALHATPTDAGAIAATPSKTTADVAPDSDGSSAGSQKPAIAVMEPDVKVVLAPETYLRPDAWSAPKRYDAQAGSSRDGASSVARFGSAAAAVPEQKEPFVRLRNTRTMTTACVAADVLEVVNSYLPHTHPPVQTTQHQHQQQQRRPHELRGAPLPLVAPFIPASAAIASVLDAGQTSHLSSSLFPNSNHDASSVRRGAKASNLVYTLEGPRAQYKKHEPEPSGAEEKVSRAATMAAAAKPIAPESKPTATVKPTQHPSSSKVQSGSSLAASSKPVADPFQCEKPAAPALLSGVALERRLLEWQRELGLLPDSSAAASTAPAAASSFTPSFAPVPVLPRMSDQALRDCRVMTVPSYPDPDPRFDPRLQDRSAVVGEVWAMWTADEKADYLYREAGTSLEAVLAAHAEQVSAAREDARCFAGFDSLQDFLATRDRLARGDVPQLTDRPLTAGGTGVNDGLALHALRPTADRISDAERLATAHQLMGVAERSLTSSEEHALRIQELHRQKMATRARGTSSRLGGAHVDEAEAEPIALNLIPTHDPARLRRADVSLVRSTTRGLASDLIVQDTVRQGIVQQASEVLARFNTGVRELVQRQKRSQEQREMMAGEFIAAEAHAVYPSGSQTARPSSAPRGAADDFPHQVAVAPFTPFLASSRLTAALSSTRSPDPWSLDRRPARLAGGVPGDRRVQGGDTVHVATQAAHAAQARAHHASPQAYAAEFFRQQQVSKMAGLAVDRDGAAAHQAHLDRLMHAMQADLPRREDRSSGSSSKASAPDPHASVAGGPRPMSPPPPQLQHFVPRRAATATSAGAQGGPSAPVQRWHLRMMAHHQREERELARAAAAAAAAAGTIGSSASSKSLRRDRSSKAHLGLGSASITSLLPSSLSQAVSGSASHSQYLSALTQHHSSDLRGFDRAMLASIEARHTEVREERLGMDMKIKLLEEEELQHQIKLRTQDQERSRAIEERRQNLLTT